jgi:hypothetical protein
LIRANHAHIPIKILTFAAEQIPGNKQPERFWDAASPVRNMAELTAAPANKPSGLAHSIRSKAKFLRACCL